MPDGTVIGWDLGGAHLKAARLGPGGAVEVVTQVACPLWQGLSHLEAGVRQVLEVVGSADDHAITMTGEMVDLFPSRPEGVSRIIAAMEALLPGVRLRFYAGREGLVDAGTARHQSALVASANWRASAELVALRHRNALLVDIGSTTADFIPVAASRVAALGASDFERLVNDELVYSGVVRTPVMALAPAVRFEGARVPLMAEYFATTADIYRLTGELPPEADLHPAADQGEKSVAGSARRLARMIGRDAESAPLAAWQELARGLRESQLTRLVEAFDRQLDRGVLGVSAPVVAAGTGRFLVEELARRRGRPCIGYASLLPPGSAPAAAVSDSAPAVAVATLAAAG